MPALATDLEGRDAASQDIAMETDWNCGSAHASPPALSGTELQCGLFKRDPRVYLVGTHPSRQVEVVQP